MFIDPHLPVFVEPYSPVCVVGHLVRKVGTWKAPATWSSVPTTWLEKIRYTGVIAPTNLKAWLRIVSAGSARS